MRALFLAMAVLLAGCTTPSADVAPADAPSADPGLAIVARPDPPVEEMPLVSPAPEGAPAQRVAFAAPVTLPIVGAIGGGEPNIAALPDGTLFVTAPAGLQMKPNALEGAAYLWRSSDGGASWETLRAPDAGPIGFGPFCSCDSDVVTSADGWVYFSDWWDANYMVERSSDGGDTWEAMPVTTLEALSLLHVDRQWLVAGDDGFLALFYAHTFNVDVPALHPVLTNGVHAVFSTDRGSTWSMPVEVVREPFGVVTQIAHPRITPTGELVMPYTYAHVQGRHWTSPTDVMLAVSADGGDTWEHHLVAEAPQGVDNLWAVQADVDASGAIHVAWSARVDDDVMATYVATSRDLGASWTDPLALRTEGLNFLPWIAAHGNGTVSVGWYGGDATGEPTEAEEPWYAYLAQSRDGGFSFAVHRVSEEPVKEGPFCPRGAACNGDRELLDYVSLVHDATGRLHYAYARSEGGVAQTLVASELLPEVAG